MDWYLQELLIHYRKEEDARRSNARLADVRARPRAGGSVRRRLAQSFVRIGVRLDADASVAVLEFAAS
jgi:hypothetical protein